MSRKCSPSRGWEPLTEEQFASLGIARERFAEIWTWAHYIGRMSPERLVQQRAYDRERGRRYYLEHKESRSQYYKDWHDKHKEELSLRSAKCYRGSSRPAVELIKNCEAGILHRPLVWSKEVPPQMWRTECGWPFGHSSSD